MTASATFRNGPSAVIHLENVTVTGCNRGVKSICLCQQCSSPIEYDSSREGQGVKCPECGSQTLLTARPEIPKLRPKPVDHWFVVPNGTPVNQEFVLKLIRWWLCITLAVWLLARLISIFS